MLTGDEVEKVEESEEPILAFGRTCLNKVVRGRVREKVFLEIESTVDIRCRGGMVAQMLNRDRHSSFMPARTVQGGSGLASKCFEQKPEWCARIQ
jgi:hypothetical protein